MSRGFRVWDTESECYLPVSKGGNDGVLGVTIDGTGVIYLEDGEVNIQSMLDGVIIERDTGLKDKNGKRICEGDIAKINNCGQYQIIWREWFCKFEFENIGKWKREEPLLTQGWKQQTEVIGNIHENPELLGD